MNDYKQIKIEFSNETQSFIESFVKNADYFKNSRISIYLSSEYLPRKWRQLYADKQAELNGRLEQDEKTRNSAFMRNQDKIQIKLFDNSNGLIEEGSFILHFTLKYRHQFDLPLDSWVCEGLYHFPNNNAKAAYSDAFIDDKGTAHTISYGLLLQEINGIKVKDIHYNHDIWSKAVENFYDSHTDENSESSPLPLIINLGQFNENQLAKSIEECRL